MLDGLASCQLTSSDSKHAQRVCVLPLLSETMICRGCPLLGHHTQPPACVNRAVLPVKSHCSEPFWQHRRARWLHGEEVDQAFVVIMHAPFRTLHVLLDSCCSPAHLPPSSILRCKKYTFYLNKIDFASLALLYLFKKKTQVKKYRYCPDKIDSTFF